MRMFCCNGMSLHNSCSVIEEFGLSEGTLGFVFGAPGPGLARSLQFRVLSQRMHLQPTFSPGFFSVH